MFIRKTIPYHILSFFLTQLIYILYNICMYYNMLCCLQQLIASSNISSSPYLNWKPVLNSFLEDTPGNFIFSSSLYELKKQHNQQMLSAIMNQTQFVQNDNIEAYLILGILYSGYLADNSSYNSVNVTPTFEHIYLPFACGYSRR
ncbi:hypothetical protein Hdeb2414_s0001g00036591 [Helianthus debilis subsp. tardiflorus]